MKTQDELVRATLEKAVEYFNSFEKDPELQMTADMFYHDTVGYLNTPEVVVDQQSRGNYYEDRFLVFYAHDWDEGGPSTFFAKFAKDRDSEDWRLQAVDHEFDTMWHAIWDEESGWRK